MNSLYSILWHATCVILSCKFDYPQDVSLNKIGISTDSRRSPKNIDIFNDSQKYTKFPPIVRTKSGFIEGYKMKTVRNREIYAFDGIPYGEDTGGENRFENPIPKKPWKNILQAKSIGKRCLQTDLYLLYAVSGSEDCLYLNVYTPSKKVLNQESTNTSLLPTLVFIHGGAWFFGSGSDYGPSYLLDHGQDIILVTINYRLGIFGFLSTFDENISGNLGYKDQVLALKWVQDNIKAFGGDPKRVTIAGQSAGASSVHFHLLSEMSRGLFSQAISMSGTVFSTWALVDKSKGQGINKKLSKATKCPLKPTSDFVKCLKMIDGEVLVRKIFRLYTIPSIPAVLLGTVVENKSPDAFLTITPNEAYKQKKVAPVPFLVLRNNKEMDIVYRSYKQMLGSKRFENIARFSKENGLILKWLSPILLDYTHRRNKNEITRKITEFYFSDQLLSNYTEKSISFLEMFNDGAFEYGAHKTIEKHSTLAPTYSWIYSYKGAHTLSNYFSVDPENSENSHTDELPVIFNSTTLYPSYKTSDPEYAVIKLLTSLISNFATLGEPLYKDDSGKMIHIWDQTNSSSFRVLSIGKKEVKMIDEPHQDRYKFWESLNLI